MKKFYPSNMYLALYNGEHIVIEATGEDMEYMLRNDPKMSDYRLFEAYKLEEHEKMPVEEVKMMKLSEWNKSLEYAEEICRKMKDIDVRVSEYSMYDGRKGIYLIAYDYYGRFYKKAASGVHDTFEEMKKFLDRAAREVMMR